MLYVYFLLALSYCLGPVSCSKCSTNISKDKRVVELKCTKLKTLQQYLDKARRNTTSIVIYDSDIPNIPGHIFARFGATLQVLDLHESGIQNIDPQAFVALTNLRELILWGNKLTWVPLEWFLNTNYLQTLDVSFNSINYIDYRAFQMLPFLENFYFDYNQLTTIDFNMFVYLTNLKRVRFENNPWDWAVKTRLTWQMEDQNVKIIEDFESWTWMSKVIKACIESGQGELPSNTVLNCVAGKLLDLTKDIDERMLMPIANQRSCSLQAQQLVSCARPKNRTQDDNGETIRVILQDLSFVLQRMKDPLATFSFKAPV